MASSAPNSNIETVRGLYESFVDGDIDAVSATWDDTIELRGPDGIVGGGTLHGRDEIPENLFAGLATD